jgi:hypothetical protein
MGCTLTVWGDLAIIHQIVGIPEEIIKVWDEGLSEVCIGLSKILDALQCKPEWKYALQALWCTRSTFGLKSGSELHERSIPKREQALANCVCVGGEPSIERDCS